jgi:hypothetical protein
MASGIPALSKPAGQADRRIAGEVERHRIGVPSGANVLDRLVVDLDRPEEVLIAIGTAARDKVGIATMSQAANQDWTCR